MAGNVIGPGEEPAAIECSVLNGNSQIRTLRKTQWEEFNSQRMGEILSNARHDMGLSFRRSEYLCLPV